PRVLEPYQSFPVQALPGPLADYVRQGAEALGCDPAFLALPALAVAASVIGNTRTICLKRGWDEPSALRSVIVGASGTLKSPAYLKAVGYLCDVQKYLMQAFREQVAKYEEELAQYQAARLEARKKGPDPGDPPKEPSLARVLCSDTTVEKLAEILEDN